MRVYGLRWELKRYFPLSDGGMHTVSCVLYSAGVGLLLCSLPLHKFNNNNKQKGETMIKQGLAWSKLNEFISKNTGMHMQDLPDFDIHNWVEDDFTEKEIDSLIPDMAWDVLDNAGMDRKTVNILCYGEDCDE